MRLSSRWWEQPALDILGIRAGMQNRRGGEETGWKIWGSRESRVGEDDG